jgi:hypothetical protein
MEEPVSTDAGGTAGALIGGPQVIANVSHVVSADGLDVYCAAALVLNDDGRAPVIGYITDVSLPVFHRKLRCGARAYTASDVTGEELFALTGDVATAALQGVRLTWDDGTSLILVLADPTRDLDVLDLAAHEVAAAVPLMITRYWRRLEIPVVSWRNTVAHHAWVEP